MKLISKLSILAASLLPIVACANKQDNLPDPKLTETWQTVTKVETTGKVPSDAVVLFDGTSLDKFQHFDSTPLKWTLNDGVMTVKPGSKGIMSKEKFCDAQIHLEWRSPEFVPGRTGQHDGNSGIYIQGRYEVQILNSYDNETYANGQAGAVYKQSIPLVNASRPRMQWQTYDIIFKAPRFDEQGKVTEKANITVLHNGVLIQNHYVLEGGTTYRGAPSYKAHGCAPISLQDHGSLVSYRNIWVRNL